MLLHLPYFSVASHMPVLRALAHWNSISYLHYRLLLCIANSGISITNSSNSNTNFFISITNRRNGTTIFGSQCQYCQLWLTVPVLLALAHSATITSSGSLCKYCQLWLTMPILPALAHSASILPALTYSDCIASSGLQCQYYQPWLTVPVASSGSQCQLPAPTR